MLLQSSTSTSFIGTQWNLPVVSPVVSTLGENSSSVIGRLCDSIASNPVNTESTVFNLVAHLILDFATVCSPDSILIRIFILIGRIFALASSLVSDQQESFIELVFQASLLYVAIDGVIKSTIAPYANYMMKSQSPPLLFRDKRLLVKLFKPLGFSWLQYMQLRSEMVLEWVCSTMRGEVFFEKTTHLILVYKGSGYFWKQDRVISGDQFRSENDLLHLGCNQITQDLLCDLVQSNVEKSACEVMMEDGLYCVESASTRFEYLRVDVCRLVEVAEMDALLKERVKALLFNELCVKRWNN